MPHKHDIIICEWVYISKDCFIFHSKPKFTGNPTEKRETHSQTVAGPPCWVTILWVCQHESRHHRVWQFLYRRHLPSPHLVFRCSDAVSSSAKFSQSQRRPLLALGWLKSKKLLFWWLISSSVIIRRTTILVLFIVIKLCPEHVWHVGVRKGFLTKEAIDYTSLNHFS